MTTAIANTPVPLKTDQDGVIRVSRSRIPLDTVVDIFSSGASPEEIVYQFPSLHLADVYDVIGYYLRNQQAVDQYFHDRQAEKREVREINMERSNLYGVRQRLLSRKPRTIPQSA